MGYNNKIKIEFRLINRFGNDYSASSETEVYDDCGHGELNIIGEKLNAFLRQVGYVMKGDFLLLEGLTEDEYDAVSCYLDQYRLEKDIKKNFTKDKAEQLALKDVIG